MTVLRSFQPHTDSVALERLIEAVDHDAPELLAREYALLEAEGFPNFDPAQDRLVLYAPDGELIGTAWIGGPRLERPDFWLCVHPQHRGQGHGTALLERVLARARERGARELAGYVREQRPELLRFAQARGFERVGFYRQMTRGADLALEPVPLPAGFAVRTYT